MFEFILDIQSISLKDCILSLSRFIQSSLLIFIFLISCFRLIFNFLSYFLLFIYIAIKILTYHFKIYLKNSLFILNLINSNHHLFVKV
jgi:hypothetical protein